MRSRLVSSGPVQVLSLRKLFAEIDDELIVRVGADGHLYLVWVPEILTRSIP